MAKSYGSTSRILKISTLVVLLFVGAANTAKACHGVNIFGLSSVTNASDLTISGSSDASTCGCGPYWMEVEVTCNPSGFTGASPAPSSPLWGTAPWYHSGLNVPGYGPPLWTEQCATEPYFDIVVPFAQLCPGTTYYWRVREYVEGSNSASTWAGPYSFTTPGLPPSAILSTTASENTVCPGDTIQLNATVSGGCPGATFSYSWVPTTGLSNPSIANPTAIVSSATVYTVTVTGGCFTITSNDDTVQVHMAPNVSGGTPTATPTSVCSGQSSVIVLTGTGTGNIQWQVSPNGISWFNISGATDDTLLTGPLSSSLYYHAIITGTGWPGSGCGTAVSTPVQVTVSPSPVADAGTGITICQGSCGNLTGTGGASYNWQPGNMGTQNITVCPTVTTTYSLTVTDASGCTATDNVTVVVSNASVTASPDVSICNGNNTILIASGPNGNTYSWTPSGSLTGANTANPTASPTVTTTYVVTSTNTNGCTAADSVVVTVTSAPPITVSNDTALCSGGSVTLTASGANSYSWQPGNQSGSSITVNPFSTTTYTVTGNNNNCLTVDSVVVNIAPPPAVFAGPDFAICNGTHATLNVSTAASNYTWQPSTSIIGSNTAQSIVIDPTANTSYTVTVTAANGCISRDTINVAVNVPPTVTATSPDNTICAGSNTTVSASGASSFVWIPSVGLQNPNQASTTANPSTTTTYQVVGTSANGCMDTASITITVNPLPGVYLTSTPTECGDTTGTIVYNGAVNGTAPYTYTIGSQTYSQSQFPLQGFGQGTYTVITTDANGCSSSQVVWVGMQNTSFVSGAASPMFGVHPLPVGFGASGSSGLTNYHWDFGDGVGTANSQSANYVYNSTGTYVVVVTAWNDLYGCAVQDTLTIEVVDEAVVKLPNVFTPNSDGTNDFFSADISGVKDMKVEVYNRWGNLVFDGSQNGLSSSPQTLTLWDGKANSGNMSADGVYYYVINAVGYDGNQYPFNGFIQILK